ncbi:hypothetical protein M3J09_011224 [Ascochyta lentis]
MDSKTSLFSRARPRVAFPKMKKARGFLDLPGEIRNRIYEYCFQSSFRCELVAQGCDLTTATPKVVKSLLNATVNSKPRHGDNRGKAKSDEPLIIRLPPRRRGSHSAVLGPRTCWLDLFCGLILVCKQIHTETLPLLYQRITFIFEAPCRISSFLRRVPQQNLDNVSKLHLYYTTYGSPSSASDVIWQDKHIESWMRACKMASKKLTCLRELEIEIWINEDAPKFNLRQKWLQPLLQFRRLSLDKNNEGESSSMQCTQKPRVLQVVTIKPRSRLWKHNFEANTRLSKACKHLHKLFGQGISCAILGAKEEEAMAKFNTVWNDKYKMWQHHLGFAKTGW